MFNFFTKPSKNENIQKSASHKHVQDLKTAEVGSGYVDMTSGGGSSLYFQYTRHRDRDRQKMRMIKSRNMRDMFSSDCEAVSVASDNPNMYHRSISMNTLLTNHHKKKPRTSRLKHRKALDSVEENMNIIQDSLSNSHQKLNKLGNCTSEPRIVSSLKDHSQSSEMFPSLMSWEEQFSARKRQIKKKKDDIKRLQDDGNIDVKISLAELEYSLEKDQIEMMNLSQKLQAARLENIKIGCLRQEENLYRHVENRKTLALIGHPLDRKQLDCIKLRPEGFGLEITRNTKDRMLQYGDRVIEVNGKDVLKILPGGWIEMLQILTNPVKIVVIRIDDNGDEDGGCIKKDINMIQTRLHEKLYEERHMSKELSSVRKQKDDLTRENTRLCHRIQYLEEHVSSLQSGLRQVRDSLAQTLNTNVLDTLHNLDSTCQGPDMEHHVASVHVSNSNDEQCSSSTSGIYSVEESDEGVSCEESWRSTLETETKRKQKLLWSSPDVSENDVSIALTNDQTNETKKYVACLVVGEETENKSKYGAKIEQKYQKNMCRSNSSVTKISNWRKSNAEENLYCESSRV